MESADRILARKAEQECKQQQKKDDAKKALEAFYNRRKSALTKRKEQNREEEKKKKDVTNRRQPPLGANRDAIDQARWRHVVSMISPEVRYEAYIVVRYSYTTVAFTIARCILVFVLVVFMLIYVSFVFHATESL